MKVKSFFRYLLLLLFLFIGGQEFYAQTQGRISSARRQFNNACVNPNNNNIWRVNFYWEGPLPMANNLFHIELSDANGTFDNPTILRTLRTEPGNKRNYDSVEGETKYSFSFPANVYGSSYKIRVRSTNPASEIIAINRGGDSGSEAFTAIWLGITTGIVVAPQNVTLCPGHTQELKVVRLPNNAPVENYNYMWYKENSNGNRVRVGRGVSFTVSEAGIYSADIDYSSCAGVVNSRSQNIQVTVSGNQSVTLSSSATEICDTEAFTLTASPADPSAKYFWYRDNTKIDETALGVNSYTVPVGQNLAGNYYVQVGSGGECDVQSNRLTIKRRDAITASITSDGGAVLMPGKNRTFTVSTTAQSPQYKWFKDGVEIAGQTAASYTANTAGAYKAQVIQTVGCAASATTTEITLKNPDSFKVTIKTKNAYQPCTTNAVTLVIDKITALSGTNELTVDPSDYNTFAFQWQANITGTYADIATATQAEISLNRALDNGKYRLKATATGFSIPESNELDVQLQDANALILNGGNSLIEFCGDTVTLTASATIGYAASSTFTWYKDNAKVDQGQGLTEYAANGSGVYFVTVAAALGGCPATSNSVVVRKITITARWADEINTREVFYQGKNNVLQVSHNMTNPIIGWSKNGSVIPGETSTQLAITTAPTSLDIYTATLTDTGNCGSVITLPPVYYETIADITEVKVGTVALSSTDCETRSQTTLEVQKIVVKLNSSGEEVEVRRSDYQYLNFQWTKDGNDIPGETTRQLVVLRAGNSESAKYVVRVSYNTSIRTSTPKAIAFTPIPDFEIASADGAKGTVYLCQGGTVTLTVAPDSFDPNATLADSFSYNWYKVTSANYTNDTPLNASAPTVNVDAIGEYYLEINNGGCPKRAHIKVENYRSGLFELGFKGKNNNSAITKVGQELLPTIIVNAEVGESVIALKKTNSKDEIEIAGGNFVWVKDDGSQKYGPILEVDADDMAGNYTLKEVSCPAEGDNAINFELKIYKVEKIPNIVTPNGDNINEQWRIPNIYSQPDVKVTIYTQEGKEIFSTTNYQNNWPDQSVYKDIGKRALIFIYVIEGGNIEKQKGVITILK